MSSSSYNNAAFNRASRHKKSTLSRATKVQNTSLYVGFHFTTTSDFGSFSGFVSVGHIVGAGILETPGCRHCTWQSDIKFKSIKGIPTVTTWVTLSYKVLIVNNLLIPTLILSYHLRHVPLINLFTLPITIYHLLCACYTKCQCHGPTFQQAGNT